MSRQQMIKAGDRLFSVDSVFDLEDWVNECGGDPSPPLKADCLKTLVVVLKLTPDDPHGCLAYINAYDCTEYTNTPKAWTFTMQGQHECTIEEAAEYGLYLTPKEAFEGWARRIDESAQKLAAYASALRRYAAEENA